MAKFAVIIPAAGAGKRFGGDVKKPFVQIDGRPIFIRSIELFISRPDVCQTILAVSPDDYDVVREKYAANLMFMDIKLIKGGNERFESVKLALDAVVEDAEFVCVHDAVRPCVLESWIDAVFEAATKDGAAILGAPLTGTVKRLHKEMIRETVPREALWEAQTPQVFAKQLLRDAYAAMPADFRPTDDAQVLERFNHGVRVVAADRRNIKITTAGDLALASAILKDISRKPKGGPLGAFQEAQW
ncbi:MAG: 2-C-methyl-D-erythritol 4-phosphate cytidylyltransferase [Phycisphaerae bacterium]